MLLSKIYSWLFIPALACLCVLAQVHVLLFYGFVGGGFFVGHPIQIAVTFLVLLTIPSYLFWNSVLNFIHAYKCLMAKTKKMIACADICFSIIVGIVTLFGEFFGYTAISLLSYKR